MYARSRRQQLFPVFLTTTYQNVPGFCFVPYFTPFSRPRLLQQDCLHAPANSATTKGAVASDAVSGTDADVGVMHEDGARPAQLLRPTEATEALAESFESGSESGEKPAGHMATSRPRLFLWQRTDGRAPPRRVVTFHDGLETAGDGKTPGVAEAKSSGVAASTADKGHEETKRLEVVSEVPGREGERVCGEVGRRLGQLSRADFIQLSYGMKKFPARGDAGGVGSSEGVACHGAWRGQVRLGRMVLGVQY